MRRVYRGPPPPGTLQHYKNAKSDLLDRIGAYCSYCERRGDLHVEHVVPKSRKPDLENDWTNFLLGCRNCNGIKGNRNQSRNGYLWPDRNDTETAFEYLPDGIVKVRANRRKTERARARKLFCLVGLGRRPGNDPQAQDRRWQGRKEAWRIAVEARADLVNSNANVEAVVRLALATGYWSVWMAVFADHPDVRLRLRSAFPGTR